MTDFTLSDLIYEADDDLIEALDEMIDKLSEKMKEVKINECNS